MHPLGCELNQGQGQYTICDVLQTEMTGQNVSFKVSQVKTQSLTFVRCQQMKIVVTFAYNTSSTVGNQSPCLHDLISTSVIKYHKETQWLFSAGHQDPG